MRKQGETRKEFLTRVRKKRLIMAWITGATFSLAGIVALTFYDFFKDPLMGFLVLMIGLLFLPVANHFIEKHTGVKVHYKAKIFVAIIFVLLIGFRAIKLDLGNIEFTQKTEATHTIEQNSGSGQ